MLSSPQGYDDGYDGEYDNQSYDTYEENYSSQSKRWEAVEREVLLRLWRELLLRLWREGSF